MPLFGDEIGLRATPIPELGSSARRCRRRPPRSSGALGAGLIPVVAPLAAGPLNVNADEAAAALAVGLGAERILFVTDVPGLLLGGVVAASIGADEARAPARRRRALRAGSCRSCAPRSAPHAAASQPRSARRRWSREHAGPVRCGSDAAAADLRARRRHVRRGRGRLARRTRTGKRYLDFARRASPSSGSATAIPRRSPPRRPSSSGSGTSRTSTGPSRWRGSPSCSPTASAAPQAFFCNSGAEAIEAALKYARKATGKTGVVALEGSFHGRTLGALAVTGQPAKRAAFEPLAPPRSLRGAERHRLARGRGRRPTSARSSLEPVQGEGGVHPARTRVPRAARAARRRARRAARLRRGADAASAGRARFFACEQLGVRPDAVTLAKGLANGLPIGALLVADDAPTGFEPGDHASTFGGNPVVCAAACAVVEAIDDELLAHVARARRAAALPALAALPGVVETRGRGPLLGAELDRPAATGRRDRLELGLVVGTAGERTLRLTPPLTITAAELDQGLSHPRGGARMNKFERQGAILRLVREQELSTQADVAARAARAGARGGADDGLARHRAARPRQGARRAAAGSSTRCPAPPTSTASAS